MCAAQLAIRHRQAKEGPRSSRRMVSAVNRNINGSNENRLYSRHGHIQSQRSAFASLSRRGRVRSSTCNWWRNASTSSWRAARERAQLQRVRRSVRKTDMMVPGAYAGKINDINKYRLFSRHTSSCSTTTGTAHIERWPSWPPPDTSGGGADDGVGRGSCRVSRSSRWRGSRVRPSGATEFLHLTGWAARPVFTGPLGA